MTKRRRGAELLVALLTLVVGIEAWWVLGRTPVALVSDGQGPILLQGDKHVDNEQSGPLVPGPQPPHMAHGEGREGAAPQPGARDGGGGQPPGPPAVGQAVPPPVGSPAAPAVGKPAHAMPPDAYHQLLVGILLLDARGELKPEQAQLLLRAVRAREALRGTDVAAAADRIHAALSPEQQAFVERLRAERIRQGKPPSAPEQLPVQIKKLLTILEKR